MSREDLELLKKFKANSVNDKKEKLEIKYKKISRKVLTFLVTIVLVLSLCACGKFVAQNGQEYNYNYTYVDMYVGAVATNLEYYLEQNNLDYFQANNTIEQYNIVKDYLDEKDMLVYYDKLGKEETNKICIVLGYQGFDDFLKQNGCVDEQGVPSISVLRGETYERVTKEMTEKVK